jgi:hypothetical protein
MWHVCERVKVHAGFWWGLLRGSDHLKDPGVGGRILLKWKFKKLDTGVDSTDMAQDRNRCTGVYKYSGSIKCGKFN